MPSGIAPSCQYEFSKPAVVEVGRSAQTEGCRIVGLLTDVIAADFVNSNRSLVLAFGGGTDGRTVSITMHCNKSASVPEIGPYQTYKENVAVDVEWAVVRCDW